MELGGEWLYETKLTGPQAEAAMERVVSQQKLMMEQRFLREGHAFASMRAAAHFSVEAAMNEMVQRRELLPLPLRAAERSRLGRTGPEAGHCGRRCWAGTP